MSVHDPGWKTRRFGVEVELTGLDPEAANATVVAYLGGDHDHLGRAWTVVADRSVPQGFELVSPPLWYADIPTLQEIFRALRARGARRTHLAGVHVHVEATDATVASLAALIDLYDSHSPVLVRALDVYSTRRLLYCQPLDELAADLRARPPSTWDDILERWYAVSGGDGPTRFDVSRYTELNLNSYFVNGTVEFRQFNSTNHAGNLRTFVNLALAMYSAALRRPERPEGPAPGDVGPEAGLDRLIRDVGLDRPEFRNTRLHLRRGLARHAARATARAGGARTWRFTWDGEEAAGSDPDDLLRSLWEAGFFRTGTGLGILRSIRRAKGQDGIDRTGGRPSHDDHAEDVALAVLEVAARRSGGRLSRAAPG